MDETSLKILKILQKKARIPNVEVSRQVGLAPSAVLERVKKLEKQGVIDGYEVLLNPSRFQRTLIGFVHVSVESGTEERVGADLSRIEDIQEVHFVTGSDTFLVKLRCKDQEALEKILTRKIRSIDGVLATTTETALSTIKETSRIPLPRLPQTDR